MNKWEDMHRELDYIEQALARPTEEEKDWDRRRAELTRRATQIRHWLDMIDRKAKP